jgi:uncharacterized protein (TIGR03382 family)
MNIDPGDNAMTRKLTIVAPLLALALLVSAPAAEAEVITLQNDGLSNPLLGVVSCGFIEGEYVAAIFQPPEGSYPLTILEVQFALAPYVPAGLMGCDSVATQCGLNFPMRIWKDDEAEQLTPSGDTIYEDLDLTLCSSLTGIASISVTEDVVVEDGLIRVAFEFPADDVAFPLRDTDGITYARNLVYGVFGSDYQWQWAGGLGVSGDWVMRVVVDAEWASDTDVDTDTDTDADSDSDSDTDSDTDADSDSDVDSDSDSDSDGDTGCNPDQCDETCVNNGFEGGSCRDGECDCLGENRDACGCSAVGAGGTPLLALLALGLLSAILMRRRA